MHLRCSVTPIRVLVLMTALIMLTVQTPRSGRASDAEKPISIGSITANPQANNRRIVLFKGKASEIRTIDGAALGILTCGQTFTLTDDTGSIDVWYMIKCHHNDNAFVVVENDQLLVSATIDAARSTDVQTSQTPDVGVRAMASKLVRLKSE